MSSIPAVFRESPQFVSEALSAALGRPVVVKADTDGSAAGRGAIRGRRLGCGSPGRRR
jgi:D-alanine-D-alanine ligase-like ATP-grasp enzyme